MTTDRYAEWDAAYVLGALADDERREFEQHLLGCQECHQAVRRLDDLPDLLASVPADDVVRLDAAEGAAGLGGPAGQGAPDTLLPTLLARVGQDQRRSRVSWVLAGAAAAAAVVAVALAAALLLGRGTQPPTQAGPGSSVTASPSPGPTLGPKEGTAFQLVGDTALRVRGAMVDSEGGTRIQLRCTYDDGTASDYYGADDYTLVVRGWDGRSEQVATWRGVHGRALQVSAMTWLSRGQISALEVRSQGGRTLLRMPVG